MSQMWQQISVTILNTFKALSKKYISYPTLLFTSRHLARWVLLKIDRGLSTQMCLLSSRKNLIRKTFFSAVTRSHRMLSCGGGGAEARPWLMCCGTRCLRLRRRVLTVFTPDLLLRVELIRTDASLSTARRAPHRSLSPLSKSGRLQLDAHFTTRRWPVTSC